MASVNLDQARAFLAAPKELYPGRGAGRTYLS
jgi:hypothetical protein